MARKTRRYVVGQDDDRGEIWGNEGSWGQFKPFNLKQAEKDCYDPDRVDHPVIYELVPIKKRKQ